MTRALQDLAFSEYLFKVEISFISETDRTNSDISDLKGYIYIYIYIYI